MDIEDMKSEIEELEVDIKPRNGGLDIARDQKEDSDWNLLELAQDGGFDADDLAIKLIKVITKNRTDDYVGDFLLPVIREFTDELNAFYEGEVEDRIEELAGDIEDLEEFGDPAHPDYEYKRNGFASARDFQNWKEG